MIQVGDGNGIDQFKVDQILSLLACEIRKTSNGTLVRELLLEALAAGAGRRDGVDDIIVSFSKDLTATFPAAMIGPPPGPWRSLKDDPPLFDSNYWIHFRGKHPFVASYDNKGWEMAVSPSKNRLNSQEIDGWKPLWGRS